MGIRRVTIARSYATNPGVLLVEEAIYLADRVVIFAGLTRTMEDGPAILTALGAGSVDASKIILRIACAAASNRPGP